MEVLGRHGRYSTGLIPSLLLVKCFTTMRAYRNATPDVATTLPNTPCHAPTAPKPPCKPCWCGNHQPISGLSLTVVSGVGKNAGLLAVAAVMASDRYLSEVVILRDNFDYACMHACMRWRPIWLSLTLADLQCFLQSIKTYTQCPHCDAAPQPKRSKQQKRASAAGTSSLSVEGLRTQQERYKHVLRLVQYLSTAVVHATNQV